MRIDVKVDGDLAQLSQREFVAGERAVTRSVAVAGATLKSLWRQQIAAANLGNRLGRTIRNASYPQGQPSMNAAALVWTKAPHIVGAHAEGALIRSQNGFWLAIPLPSAGKGKFGARITPGQWEARTGRRLRFVFRSGRTALLIDEGRAAPGNVMVRKRGRGGSRLAAPTTFRNRTVPIFALVPFVRLKKRLDLARATAQATAGLPSQIIANWR